MKKCIKLIEDYNNKITINKRKKQNILQIVNDYWKNLNYKEYTSIIVNLVILFTFLNKF